MNARTIPAVDAPPVGRRQRRKDSPEQRRAADTPADREVRDLLGSAPRERDLLIEHLHRLQDHFGHLSAPHLVALAREMSLPETEVREVAAFYPHFEIVEAGAPPPALTVRVCDGLSCEMAGAVELLSRLSQSLGQGVRVATTPCMGRCEQAPAVAVGRHVVGRATCAAVIHKARSHATQAWPVAEGFIDHARYVAQGGYRLLKRCIAGEIDADTVIQSIEDSGLRGLGGAGVPVGRKWRMVHDELAPRLMAVNIGETEPGSFKDRAHLERDPHRFLEGMLIAAWAVGASRIYVYLRGEYHACRTMLAIELARLCAKPPYPGMPEIVLRRGAGAYVCGEESALIESLEGKRGKPRPAPPHIAQIGLFGRPTLEHNFETLYWVRDILDKGSAWFASHGRHGAKGLRSYSVSGRVKTPGVKLAPAGTTVRELIDEHCGGMLDGHRLYAYLPGGASGGILPASMDDIPLDFDTLPAHGGAIRSAAIVVLSDHDTAVDAARNLMRFFARESCGECASCRGGIERASALVNEPRWNVAALQDLLAAMREPSGCSLGPAAASPIDCVIRHFPHELS